MFGPPCAGKTTYVRERAKPGDLILDSDAIYAALSGQKMHLRPEGLRKYVWDAYNAALHRLAHEPRQTAWVIQTGAKRTTRQRLTVGFYRAETVVLETPEEECLRRAKRLRRPAHWQDAIRDWWANYEPYEGDTRIAP